MTISRPGILKDEFGGNAADSRPKARKKPLPPLSLRLTIEERSSQVQLVSPDPRWTHLDGAPEALDRLVEATDTGEEVSEIVVHMPIVGMEPEGNLVACDRLVDPALRPKNGGDPVVTDGVLGIDRERTIVELDRLLGSI